MGGMSKDDIAKLQKMTEEMQKAAQSGDFGKMQEMTAQVMGNVPGIAGISPAAALSGQKERIRLVDLTTGAAPRDVAVSKGMMGMQNSILALNPTASLLAYSGGGATIHLLDVASGREVGTVTAPRALNSSKFEFSPDGKIWQFR